VKGPRAFQAVRRAEDVIIEDYMIGQLFLSATDASGCILHAAAVQACTKVADASFSLFSATQRLRGSFEPGWKQTAGVTEHWDLTKFTLLLLLRIQRYMWP